MQGGNRGQRFRAVWDIGVGLGSELPRVVQDLELLTGWLQFGSGGRVREVMLPGG